MPVIDVAVVKMLRIRGLVYPARRNTSSCENLRGGLAVPTARMRGALMME